MINSNISTLDTTQFFFQGIGDCILGREFLLFMESNVKNFLLYGLLYIKIVLDHEVTFFPIVPQFCFLELTL